MSKVVYRSKMFRVERDSFTANGRKFVFDRIAGANTVTVLPVLDDGRIILERQYRYSIGRYLYELPAGHIEGGESAREAASRELEEEPGYRPGYLKALFSAYPSPGSKTELATYFIAKELVKTRTNREPDEIISLKIVAYRKALELVRKNQIVDLKTIACLLFYAKEGIEGMR